MDKIWDRNPSKSEVIGRCGGDKKTEWPRRTGKSQILKKEKKEVQYYPMDAWESLFLYLRVLRACLYSPLLLLHFNGIKYITNIYKIT